MPFWLLGRQIGISMSKWLARDATTLTVATSQSRCDQCPSHGMTCNLSLHIGTIILDKGRWEILKSSEPFMNHPSREVVYKELAYVIKSSYYVCKACSLRRLILPRARSRSAPGNQDYYVVTGSTVSLDVGAQSTKQKPGRLKELTLHFQTQS